MFEDRLKRLREARGLSQKEAAEALGIPPTTYSGYENNKREPNSTILIKLGRYFGVTLDYLLDYHCENLSKDENVKSNIIFTGKEEQQIKKYRTLDEHGKKAVDGLLDNEYERCAANKEEKYTRFVAARSENGQSPMRIEEVSKKAHEDLINAPETDMDL